MLTPSASLSCTSLSRSGIDCALSHLETACRVTISFSASSSCDQPFCLRRADIFSENVMLSSCCRDCPADLMAISYHTARLRARKEPAHLSTSSCVCVFPGRIYKSAPHFVQGACVLEDIAEHGFFSEQSGRAAGMPEDDVAALFDLAGADVVDQTGKRLSGVDRVYKQTL